MINKTLIFLFSSLLFSSLSYAELSVATSSNSKSIGLYDVYELTMKYTAKQPLNNPEKPNQINPWQDIEITAVFNTESKSITIEGFFYDIDNDDPSNLTGIWKLRFAPMKIGDWAWKLTFSDNTVRDSFQTSGNFSCIASDNVGILRKNPDNPYFFTTDQGIADGSNRLFFPEGFCYSIRSTNILSGKMLPLDMGNNYTLADFFDAYKYPSCSMFRINTFTDCGRGNNSPNLGTQPKPDSKGRCICDIPSGINVDYILQVLHTNHIQPWMVMLDVNTDNKAASQFLYAYNKTYTHGFCKYSINRWGAYVSVWELSNEVPAKRLKPEWYSGICSYIKQEDPYNYLIGVSYGDPLAAKSYDVLSPHMGTLAYDSGESVNCVNNINNLRNIFEKSHNNPKQPVIIGECEPVSHPYDSRGFRIGMCTYFFKQAYPLEWGLLSLRERSVINLLNSCFKDLDPKVNPIDITINKFSDKNNLHSYFLGSDNDIAGYFVYTPTRQLATASGLNFSLTVPASGMKAFWIDPVTGKIIKENEIEKGQQSLTAPDFDTDIMLRIKKTNNTEAVINFSQVNYLCEQSSNEVILEVTRTGDLNSKVSVNYNTISGKARSGTDFTEASGTLTWEPKDSSSKQIQIPIINNGKQKYDNDFYVKLSEGAGTNCKIGSYQYALVEIFANQINSVRFASGSESVSKTDDLLKVTVLRFGKGIGEVSVNFTTSKNGGGTAVDGVDYKGNIYNVKWADKDMEPKVINIPLLPNKSGGEKRFRIDWWDSYPGNKPGSGLTQPPEFFNSILTDPSICYFYIEDPLTESSGSISIDSLTKGIFPVCESDGFVSIGFVRTFGMQGQVSVDYTVFDLNGNYSGNAQTGINYLQTKGTLGWTDSDCSTKTVKITILPAGIQKEKDFGIRLSNYKGFDGSKSILTSGIIEIEPTSENLVKNK